jgi:hypothetical protein
MSAVLTPGLTQKRKRAETALKCPSCNTDVSTKQFQGNRAAKLNFQRTYLCQRGCWCRVVCVACKHLGEEESSFVVFCGPTDSASAVKNSKSQHQRVASNRHNHENYAAQMAVTAAEPEFSGGGGGGGGGGSGGGGSGGGGGGGGGSEYGDYDGDYAMDVGVSEGDRNHVRPQTIPLNVMAFCQASGRLPGDARLHETKLPTTKIPPRHKQNIVGLSFGRPQPSLDHVETEFGVQKDSFDHANLSKPCVLGSTEQLTSQINSLTKYGAREVFRGAVCKTFKINATQISDEQLNCFKELYRLAETMPQSMWPSLAVVQKQQEKSAIQTAVGETKSDIADFLARGGHIEASEAVLGCGNLEENIVDKLLKKLHPDSGVYNVTNYSGVPQTSADLQRLVKNVRNTIPVANYTMVSPHVAAAPIGDIVATMMAQLHLNMNAIVGDQVRDRVSSIYQSKEVIEGKREWVESCVYYFRDGWETFSIQTMPGVLAKAQQYNEHKTIENATFELQSEESEGKEYDFRLPQDTGTVTWNINFGKGYVDITIGENVSKALSTLFNMATEFFFVFFFGCSFFLCLCIRCLYSTSRHLSALWSLGYIFVSKHVSPRGSTVQWRPTRAKTPKKSSQQYWRCVLMGGMCSAIKMFGVGCWHSMTGTIKSSFRNTWKTN